jgi:hypothetical protein
MVRLQKAQCRMASDGIVGLNSGDLGGKAKSVMLSGMEASWRHAIPPDRGEGWHARPKLGSPHSDGEGFGTKSLAFQEQAIGRLGAILRRKGAALPTQTKLNAGLAAIDGLNPADEIEAMLAAQMVATHDVAMEMLTRAKQAEHMSQLQDCGALAVKLLRTYTAQVEALARLRRGGEQRVIVQ